MLTEFYHGHLFRHDVKYLHCKFYIGYWTISLLSPSIILSAINERNHPLHYIIPSLSTISYQNSFFSRTTTEWNTLPLNLIETPDPNTFTALIQYYYCNWCMIFFFLEHTSRPDCSVQIIKRTITVPLSSRKIVSGFYNHWVGELLRDPAHIFLCPYYEPLLVSSPDPSSSALIDFRW